MKYAARHFALFSVCMLSVQSSNCCFNSVHLIKSNGAYWVLRFFYWFRTMLWICTNTIIRSKDYCANGKCETFDLFIEYSQYPYAWCMDYLGHALKQFTPTTYYSFMFYCRWSWKTTQFNLLLLFLYRWWRFRLVFFFFVCFTFHRINTCNPINKITTISQLLTNV